MQNAQNMNEIEESYLTTGLFIAAMLVIYEAVRFVVTNGFEDDRLRAQAHAKAKSE